MCLQALAIPRCVSPRQVANTETVHVDSDGVGIVRILRLWHEYGNNCSADRIESAHARDLPQRVLIERLGP
jgi:hypothetical protein